MAQAAPNLCVNKKKFLKHLVNLNAVCGGKIQDQPWPNIWYADNPVRGFERTSGPAGWTLCTNKVIRVPNKDKPWFNDQCHPNSEKSTVLICCQLPTDFHNISIV